MTRSTSLSDEALSSEFDRAAPRYDLMVALNPGYHRHLRAASHELIRTMPYGPLRLLDLGCGSGASTRALLRVLRGRTSQVVGVDASAGMLDAARRRSWPDGVRFVHAPAGALTGELVGAPLDGVLAAYLFRNVPAADRDDALRRVYDVLRPGGTLVVQEYSTGRSWWARAVWTLVCWLVVIPLSALTTRRTRLYRYLWRSVLAFDSTEQFAARLTAAGFGDVRTRTVGGWQRGILHTVTARRPA